jgi:nucleoside-diphosphate-sugar epimerase
MKKALIGYTGFVGGNLAAATGFEARFNSHNIDQVSKQKFDLVVVAAPSAVKWQANARPGVDWQSIQNLMDSLAQIKTKQLVQISTVDIYNDFTNADEDNFPDVNSLEPYGAHRYKLEEFVRENFKNCLIVRLPGLFGPGLKKNFIYDLMTTGQSPWTHPDSQFQFYDLRHLWQQIQIAMENNLALLNLATEPVKAKEVAKEVFNIYFNQDTAKAPVIYDMKTKYFKLFGGEAGYIFNKEQVIKDLKAYVA